MRILDVYFHRQKVGELIQDKHGQMCFTYSELWLKKPRAVPLSQSLPLQQETFKRNQCRGFFGGILPEESKREMIAKNLGISARNDFAMLEQIGGECAGAITFLASGASFPDQNFDYHVLDEPALSNILSILPKRPLMAGEAGVRLSLAGAQDKIAIHVKGNQLSVPLGGAPSTHILKPVIDRFPDTVQNEAFCMNLAAAVNLPVAAVSTHDCLGIEYLLVERYDRHVDDKDTVVRLHQEDFCQALGVASEMKYQAEGGVSLKQSFNLIRRVSSLPIIDLQHLLNAVIFNVLIGNHDAHGKNFSLLYQAGQVRLAPLYDLLCTTYYPELSKKMAMKIGGEYESDRLFASHFEKLAREVGLSPLLVKERVIELAKSVLSALQKVQQVEPKISDLRDLIASRCRLILERVDT